MIDRRVSSSLRELVARLVATQRRPTVWVLTLAVVNMGAQGATVALLVPLLRAAGVPAATGVVGGFDRGIQSAFSLVGLTPTLAVVLLAFIAVAWAQALLDHLELVQTARLEQAFVHELRESLYQRLLAARWGFFTARRGSDLTHAITRDADRAGAAVGYLLRCAAQLASVAVYGGLAIVVSPVASGVALAGGLLLILLLRPALRTAHATGEALGADSTEALALVTQHVDAVKLVKSYGAEERTFQAFRDAASRLAGSTVEATRAHARAHVATVAGSATLLGVILFVAIRLLHLDPAATLLLAFLFWRLVPRLMDVQQTLRFAVHELPGFEIVTGLLAASAAAREAGPPQAPHVSERRPPAIAFDHVSFAYDSVPVLVDVTCRIEAGTITAFAGPSGSGKTTLVDLVLGLITPTAGVITVDGALLSADRLAGWRATVAYVPQEPLLFHDTVLANLRWANPAATNTDVGTALRAAAAEAFVTRLPAGLDTVVGDRGVRLSGGERQRLALARALLRQPTVLVLDEATSAIDGESEERILDAIEAVRGSITTILVSHRAAPLRRADVVYRLRDGTAVRQPSVEV